MVKEIISKNRNKNTTLYCIKKLMRFLMLFQICAGERGYDEKGVFCKYM